MSIYTPLDTGRNEIRLLDIQPASFDAPIRCDLWHAELTPGLTFTALSYTWGDPIIRKTITINGASMEVTVNLFDALQHMRSADEARTFWIDAVCIDQENLEERSAQVLRMCDIYTMATKVEVWLGREESEHDAEAMTLIQELCEATPDAEEVLAKGLNEKHREEFLFRFAESSSEKLRALCRLFKRPWWTRIWVVQELSLAKQDRAVVRCGKHTAPWLEFLVAAYAIDNFWDMVCGIIWNKYQDETVEGHQHGIRMAQCRNVDSTLPGFTLLELLNQHRDCAATDPRDKVYGLLGLAGDVKTIGLTPSYTSTPKEIYIDLFQRHIRATGSLDMICSVRFPKNIEELPSWAPDWSTDQTVPGICINDRYIGGNNFQGSPIAQFEKYCASGDTSSDASLPGDAMIVSIVHVGTISYLGQVDPGMTVEDLDIMDTLGMVDEEGYSGSISQTFNEWCNLMLKCPEWDKIEARYGREGVLEAFCRTLIGDRNGRMMRPVADPGSEDEDGETHDDDMTDIEDDEPSEGSKDAANSDGEQEEGFTDFRDTRLFSPMEMLNITNEDYRSCLQISYGKRFALLDSGHIGIVPGHSIVGDSVVVVVGCSMPLVVQKSATKTTFVGECYVHGAMNGEAMVGRRTSLVLL
ncbi:heterokaryon incompatibility protein-domain-containing protein [Lophiotrema nucula]|uniref:Heterokaryon incompatibility protein-domain-containing protein n=1 Tax=Lophiotrema nucula TaxID=690887 RepID=A0A6A5ZUS3_9PLEO|nr:heterokaryon incompatibility protein-domain-containing protein [Lophiotrema nucula]